LSDFNENSGLSTGFRKILKYQILWFFSWPTDRHDEANSRFSKFYNPALKGLVSCFVLLFGPEFLPLFSKVTLVAENRFN